jgi:hypothetical protein
VGGVDAITPYPNRVSLTYPNKTQLPEADSLVVFGEQGLQADYWNMSISEEPFTNDTCRTWATQGGGAAFTLCIKGSSLSRDVIVAGKISAYKWLNCSYFSLQYRNRKRPSLFARYGLAIDTNFNVDCHF